MCRQWWRCSRSWYELILYRYQQNYNIWMTLKSQNEKICSNFLRITLPLSFPGDWCSKKSERRSGGISSSAKMSAKRKMGDMQILILLRRDMLWCSRCWAAETMYYWLRKRLQLYWRICQIWWEMSPRRKLLDLYKLLSRRWSVWDFCVDSSDLVCFATDVEVQDFEVRTNESLGMWKKQMRNSGEVKDFFRRWWDRN